MAVGVKMVVIVIMVTPMGVVVIVSWSFTAAFTHGGSSSLQRAITHNDFKIVSFTFAGVKPDSAFAHRLPAPDLWSRIYLRRRAGG
jgi:hypothetical protein